MLIIIKTLTVAMKTATLIRQSIINLYSARNYVVMYELKCNYCIVRSIDQRHEKCEGTLIKEKCLLW